MLDELVHEDMAQVGLIRQKPGRVRHATFDDGSTVLEILIKQDEGGDGAEAPFWEGVILGRGQ